MPTEAQSYVSSLHTSRTSSRIGDSRRMELNTTHTKFPPINQLNNEDLDLAEGALAEARPMIRKTENEIQRLRKQIEDISIGTDHI